MAKEKKVKKENKKTKAKKSSLKINAIFRPWLMVLFSMWAVSGLVVFLIQTGPGQDINEKLLARHVDMLSTNISENITAQLNGLQNQLTTLSGNPQIIQALQAQDMETLKLYESLLVSSFKHSVSLQLIPWDFSATVGLKERGFVATNNIETMMITKAGGGKQPLPEAFIVDGEWHITFAQPVQSGKDVIGVILLSTTRNIIEPAINQPRFTDSARIQISHKGQKTKQIIAFGKGSGTHKFDFDIPISGAHANVEIAEASLSDIQASFPTAYIFIAGATLFTTLIIFAGYFLTSRMIMRDVTAIVHFADSLTGLHKTKPPKLINPSLEKVIISINSLSRMTVKTGVNPESNDSKKPRDNRPPPPKEIAKAEVKEDNTFEAKHIFRDYDIRGIADTELTPENVVDIGKAIASEAKGLGATKIIVGRDGRLSSDRIFKDLSQGLCSGGLDVINIGKVPSPVLYFASHQLECEYAVMITASHNPKEFNGFKIILAGQSLQGPQIQRLLKRIEEHEFTSGEGKISQQDIKPDYIEAITSDIMIAQPIKVVIDAGNGIAGDIAPALFSQLNCEVIPLYCEVDGNFPNHSPDPTQASNLTELISAINQNGADLGIALDGDGDRLVVVTSSGAIIPGDQLLMIFAQDIVSRNPASDVVFDIKCSKNITKMIHQYGGRPIQWKSGHSHIKQKMQETGALLGGEFTGHFFFKERWFGFDDGIYAALRLIELITSDEFKLDDRIAELPTSFSTPEIYIKTDSEAQKKELITKLQTHLANESGEIATLDGIRVDYPAGWGLIRASNTSQNLTTRFEGDSAEELARIQSVFREALNAVAPDLSIPF